MAGEWGGGASPGRKPLFSISGEGDAGGFGMCVPGESGQSFGVMTDFGATEVGEGFSSAEPLSSPGAAVCLGGRRGGSPKRRVEGRERVETSVWALREAPRGYSGPLQLLGYRGLRASSATPSGLPAPQIVGETVGRNPHVEFVECLEVLQSALTSLIHLFPFLVAFNNN